MMTVAVLLGLCDGVGCGVKTTGFSGVQAARSNTVRAKYLVIRSLQSDNLRVRLSQFGVHSFGSLGVPVAFNFDRFYAHLHPRNLRVRFPQRGDKRRYVCSRGCDERSVMHSKFFFAYVQAIVAEPVPETASDEYATVLKRALTTWRKHPRPRRRRCSTRGDCVEFLGCRFFIQSRSGL